MDVYDEVDRRETDAGETLNQWHRQVARGCKIHHSHISPIELFQCGWPLRTTAHWWQTRLWCLSCPSIPNIPPLETRQVLLLWLFSLLQKLYYQWRFLSMRFDCWLLFFSLVFLKGRQKLARFSAHEFATLVIDILTDAKRRQWGNSCESPKGEVPLHIFLTLVFLLRLPCMNASVQFRVQSINIVQNIKWTRAMSRFHPWITTSSLFTFRLRVNCRPSSR